MNVSIIICTRNRAEHLRGTLNSLNCVQVPSGLSAELIVVDNSSTDHTKAMVEGFTLQNMPLRLIQEHRPNKCWALNTGMAQAQGEIFLFTDDDLRLPSDWLQGMCRPIQAGQAEAVAGRVTLAPHLLRPWMEQVHRYWLAETGPPGPHQQVEMVGANMAFARGVLEKVPNFDTNLGPGAIGFSDDTLFSKQLWAAGCKIFYADQVGVEHHFEADRLARTSFLGAARKHGEAKAYIAHHWEHTTVAAPAAQMARKWLQVALWRRRHPRESGEVEGLATGEMYNLEAYHYYRHYLIERQKPRLYDKHGLRKRSI